VEVALERRIERPRRKEDKERKQELTRTYVKHDTNPQPQHQVTRPVNSEKQYHPSHPY
jgi:hypothetical protein